MNIIEFIKEKNKVYFQYFRDGNFFYSVHRYGTNEYYHFPVPLDDIGTATMENQDKALLFMRWIQKAIKDQTFKLVSE